MERDAINCFTLNGKNEIVPGIRTDLHAGKSAKIVVNDKGYVPCARPIKGGKLLNARLIFLGNGRPLVTSSKHSSSDDGILIHIQAAQPIQNKKIWLGTETRGGTCATPYRDSALVHLQDNGCISVFRENAVVHVENFAKYPHVTCYEGGNIARFEAILRLYLRTYENSPYPDKGERSRRFYILQFIMLASHVYKEQLACILGILNENDHQLDYDLQALMAEQLLRYDGEDVSLFDLLRREQMMQVFEKRRMA